MLAWLTLALVAAAVTASVIPVHVPMNGNFEAPAQYTVPYWLGAFSVDTPDSTNWSLPAMYNSGGKVMPGQFFFIRNFGPNCIPLNSYPGETIDDEPVYWVPQDAAITIMANYPNWVVVNEVNMDDDPVCEEPSSSSGTFASSGTELFNKLRGYRGGRAMR